MVNPIATINSLQMMLKWLGDTKNNKELVRISDIVHNAVSDQIKGRKVVTYDLGGNATTSEVGDDLVKRLEVLLD